MAFQAIYYSINRNWLPIHIFGLIWCFFSLIAVFTIPESPKFYYANRRYGEARQSLKIIAKYNKGGITPEQVDELVFDTEASIIEKIIEKDEPDSSTIDSALIVNASIDSSENVENEPLM